MVRKLVECFILGMIYGAAFVSVMLLIGILAYVFARGIPFVNWSFITTVTSILHGTTGIAGNLVNTIYVVMLTLIVAVPVGVGAAVWLSEYAGGGWWVKLIVFTTQTLAGMPSVIFGLFGIVFFGVTLGLGYSVLTGSLTLTLMILPLITRNTQEALKAVPDSYRMGAAGMGATKWYMIRTVLLPAAMPGIVTGVILAVGRIVGESAALFLTAGSGYMLPGSWRGFLHKAMESGGTLTVQMYLSMSKAQYGVAFGIGSVLLGLVLVMNLCIRLIAVKGSVHSKPHPQ